MADVSDTSQGPGWWAADDGKFYAPELHPDHNYRDVWAGRLARGEVTLNEPREPVTPPISGPFGMRTSIGSAVEMPDRDVSAPAGRWGPTAEPTVVESEPTNDEPEFAAPDYGQVDEQVERDGVDAPEMADVEMPEGIAEEVVVEDAVYDEAEWNEPQYDDSLYQHSDDAPVVETYGDSEPLLDAIAGDPVIDVPEPPVVDPPTEVFDPPTVAAPAAFAPDPVTDGIVPVPAAQVPTEAVPAVPVPPPLPATEQMPYIEPTGVVPVVTPTPSAVPPQPPYVPPGVAQPAPNQPVAPVSSGQQPPMVRPEEPPVDWPTYDHPEIAKEKVDDPNNRIIGGLLLAAALAITAGSFMPWVRFGGAVTGDSSGWLRGDGKATVLFAFALAAIAGAIAMGARHLYLKLGAMAAAGAVVVIFAIEALDIWSENRDLLNDGVGADLEQAWGLWLVGMAAVVAVVLTIVERSPWRR